MSDGAKPERSQASSPFEREPILFRCGPGPAYRVQYVSPSVRQLGYEPEDFTSRRSAFRDIVHPDDWERVEREDASCRAARAEVALHEYRLLGADGEVRWFSDFTVLRWSAAGEMERAEGWLVDVTESRRAREDLGISEARYRSIVEDQDELLIARARPDGVLTFVNDAFCRYYGVRREDVIGTQWRPQIHPDDYERLAAEIHAIDSSNPIVNCEVRVQLADGSVRWKRWTTRAMYAEDGTPLEFQATSVDITERKLLEERLRSENHDLEARVRERTARLEDANHRLALHVAAREAAEAALRRAERLASMGTLAAGIAHEINNPLAAIRMAVELGLVKREDPRAVERALRDIDRLVQRCARIVTGVLEFSRGQSSERMPANLLEIARAALAAPQAQAAARGVELALRAPAGVPVLWLDETQIEQLLGNLLANGVEACGERGRVELRVEVRSDAVCVIVADDGCGMPEDERQQAFQPFWSRRKARGGTGLGLFIARAIAASHGGTLELASDPGKGTQAILTLPRSRPQS